jgi:RimJ/RimL family protein N-acetyltransferase
MDPLLIDIPERIATERLVLRCPQPGDGACVNAAVAETIDELRPYMPWAQTVPTMDESEAHVRRTQAKFRLREDLVLMIFERASDGSEGDFLGGTGLHRIDWALRRFEIGYWRRRGREGRGVITEAVHAVVRLAFDGLQAQRVELRMDNLNERSRRVAERAGFTLEGVLRRDSVSPQGEPRDTRVYAKVRGIEVPDAPSIEHFVAG